MCCRNSFCALAEQLLADRTPAVQERREPRLQPSRPALAQAALVKLHGLHNRLWHCLANLRAILGRRRPPPAITASTCLSGARNDAWPAQSPLALSCESARNSWLPPAASSHHGLHLPKTVLRICAQFLAAAGRLQPSRPALAQMTLLKLHGLHNRLWHCLANLRAILGRRRPPPTITARDRSGLTGIDWD